MRYIKKKYFTNVKDVTVLFTVEVPYDRLAFL